MKISYPMQMMLKEAPTDWRNMGYFQSPSNKTMAALERRGLVEFRLRGYEGGKPSVTDWVNNQWQWRKKPNESKGGQS